MYCNGLYIVQYTNIMLFYNGGALTRMSHGKNCFELQSLMEKNEMKLGQKKFLIMKKGMITKEVIMNS